MSSEIGKIGFSEKEFLNSGDLDNGSISFGLFYRINFINQIA